MSDELIPRFRSNTLLSADHLLCHSLANTFFDTYVQALCFVSLIPFFFFFFLSFFLSFILSHLFSFVDDIASATVLQNEIIKAVGPENIPQSEEGSSGNISASASGEKGEEVMIETDSPIVVPSSSYSSSNNTNTSNNIDSNSSPSTATTTTTAPSATLQTTSSM